MKNPWDVVSGFKHDNRLKCHRGIVSQWMFQLGLNVTVDETWVDVKAPEANGWTTGPVELCVNAVILQALHMIYESVPVQ